MITGTKIRHVQVNVGGPGAHKSYGVNISDIQMKRSLESQDEILCYCHSNESSSAVFWHSTICVVLSCNFWICRYNFVVWLISSGNGTSFTAHLLDTFGLLHDFTKWNFGFFINLDVDQIKSWVYASFRGTFSTCLWLAFFLVPTDWINIWSHKLYNDVAF